MGKEGSRGLDDGQNDSDEQRYVHSKAKFVIQEDMLENMVFIAGMLL